MRIFAVILFSFFLCIQSYGQHPAFNIISRYKKCDSIGSIIILPVDTTQKYKFIMMSNDCGFVMSAPQDSGIFNHLPPCNYVFKVINALQDTVELSPVNPAIRILSNYAFRCTGSPFAVLQITLSGGSNLSAYQLDGAPAFKVTPKDTVFNLEIPARILDSGLIYIIDSCGNRALIKSNTGGFIQKETLCDERARYSIPLVNFKENTLGGIDSFVINWSIDGKSISDKNSIIIDHIPPGKWLVCMVKKNLNSCIFTDSIIIENDISHRIDVKLMLNKSILCPLDSALLMAQVNSLFPYHIIWDKIRDTSNVIVVKSPGVYTLVAQNDQGCSDTTSITIRQSSPAIQSTITPNLCFAESNGRIDLSLSDGTVPYKYLWKDNAFTEDRFNLQSGKYSVIVTDSAGCEVKDTFIINSPPPLQLSLSAHAADCIPAHNGTVTSKGSGGVPPYRFQWSNGLTVPDVDTLSPATYTLTLIDSNQCRTSFEFKIDNLNPFRSSWADTICANASLKIGKSIHSLSGRYTDSLISSRGCDSIVTTFLTVNEPVDFSLTSKDPTCNNLDDGKVVISDIRGYPGYQYSLNDKSISLNQLNMFAPGNYVIKVRDRFDCVKEKGFAITNPPKINFNLGKDTTLAYGDTLIINPSTSLPSKDIKRITWLTSSLQGTCILCDSIYKYLPKEDHTLKATIESITGCKVTDEINILVDHDFKVFVPNVFMPQVAAQSENLSLTVYGGKQVVKVNYFRIFNRYGDEVYEARAFQPNDRSVAWDGRYKGSDAAEDVYVYLAEIVFADGSIRVVKGDVTLIR
jgi:hypothetical protein